MPIKKGMPERRRESRMLCADMVDLSWSERSGRCTSATALLEDISTSGACLQTERQVPINVHVTMRHEDVCLGGVVRYCVFREIGYYVGIQFDFESQWTPDDFQPQHLVDLEKLINRCKKES
jgi:hypothetical protein